MLTTGVLYCMQSCYHGSTRTDLAATNPAGPALRHLACVVCGVHVAHDWNEWRHVVDAPWPSCMYACVATAKSAVFDTCHYKPLSSCSRLLTGTT